MSDIFISYSRKDSEQALQLAERLQGEGMSVWIDQRGIEAAKSWSKEIVQAIDNCKAFVVLISGHSMASENVVKEVSLACEAKKKVLPISIEDIRLNDDLRYHLAGIQRVAYAQFDAITQALVGFGVLVKNAADNSQKRKTLMVLPFEDLSPTQDNGWFADGLVSELIDKLGNIKALKLVDRQTSLQIKKKGHSIAELASILETRYFIEGSIRKFGEQIKISAGLLDFETGDYLWQDTHKGVFADIFEIQEAIADKVVAGLKLHLGSEEKQEIEKKSTKNAEAYELYLKGVEESSVLTRERFERAISLYSEAVILDPQFAGAYANLAGVHFSMYRMYSRSPSRLISAGRAIDEVRRIEGESKSWCWGMSRLERAKGEYLEAERYARQAIALDPEYALGYDALSFALQLQDRFEEAVEARTEYVRRLPEPTAYFNLINALSERGDSERIQSEVRNAMPIFERHLKLNPEDSYTAVNYVILLHLAGKREEAQSRASELLENPTTDVSALSNLACLMCSLNENGKAIEALTRAMELGHSDLEWLRRDPDLTPIRDTPEFKAILADLEARIAAQQASLNEAKAV